MGASGAFGQADERTKFAVISTSGEFTAHACASRHPTVTDGLTIINELTKSESNYPRVICLDHGHQEEARGSTQDTCDTGDTEQKKSGDQ